MNLQSVFFYECVIDKLISLNNSGSENTHKDLMCKNDQMADVKIEEYITALMVKI
jgi:hypothetical protein